MTDTRNNQTQSALPRQIHAGGAVVCDKFLPENVSSLGLETPSTPIPLLWLIGKPPLSPDRGKQLAVGHVPTPRQLCAPRLLPPGTVAGRRALRQRQEGCVPPLFAWATRLPREKVRASHPHWVYSIVALVACTNTDLVFLQSGICRDEDDPREDRLEL